jgi:hypothetical protein
MVDDDEAGYNLREELAVESAKKYVGKLLIRKAAKMRMKCL